MTWRHWAVLLLLMLAFSARSQLQQQQQQQPQPEPLSWPGIVSYVVDGDTLHVRPMEGGAVHKIRLIGIDAPEICQTGGVAARKALHERIHRRAVMVSPRGVDVYGRDLAAIYLSREDVGQWMVQRGHAWSSRYQQDSGLYAQEEENAIFLGRGLFAQMPAEYPRDFRRRHGRCQFRR